MVSKKQEISQKRPYEIEFARRLCIPSKFSCDLDVADIEHLNWELMIRYSVRNGLTPLVFDGLIGLMERVKGIKIDRLQLHDLGAQFEVGKEQLDLLKDSYFSTLKRNMHISKALKELDEVISQRGITCILWKGAGLIFDVYDSFALRPMDDIDLLIPPKHIEEFASVLENLGFRPRSIYPLTWYRREIVVDLHMDIVHSDRIPSRLKAIPVYTADLASQSCILNGFQTILTLSPADSLICLAIHALKHGFSRDIWFIDSFYLMNRYPELIDYPEDIIKRANDLGVLRPLAILFFFLDKWPVDKALHQDLQSIYKLELTKLGILPRYILRSIAHGKTLPYSGELFYFLLMDSNQKRVAFLWDTLFPSKHVLKQLFPNMGSMPYWFYYLRRFFSLICMGFKFLKVLFNPFAKKR
ncbi:MAG: nucleotidyltransferase family protein [Thermodesulfobacteriota bacterium]|nr:nucleotidyltransferase family protein [Thermodesulfobacteriota bacterium]